MPKCRVCGGTDFYKEAGYFFCQTCQTQHEDIREEVLELHIDNKTRLRKTKIRQLKSQSSGEELGWTSWELYNFILIGLSNELIELGVPPDIKLTILQLWATYLGKLEVAFISTKKKCLPRLAKRYNKRDAEIIYGKTQQQKRKRKRRRTGSSTNTSVSVSGLQSEGSSTRELNKNKKLLITADYDRYLQSQGSSEVDGLSMFSQSAYSVQSSSVNSSDDKAKVQFSSHAKEETRKIKRLSKNLPRNKRVNYRAKHISTRYRVGPHVITPMKLWAIIYLALRIHNQPIQLGDMLRYGREGHLSYYKLDHLLPPEVNITKDSTNFLTQNVEITHKGMRQLIASMAKLLGVWDIACPELLPLVNRYCQELCLPKGIQLYTERLIALSPPKMIFNAKKSSIPNYEGRVMAFIIVVLKTLFALDDVTEYHISRISEKINSLAIERGLLTEKLFSFREWQRYIEGRKIILSYSHFPTKVKYCPDLRGVDDLYLKYLEFLTCKSDKKESDIKMSKHCLPEELIHAMKRYIINLSSNDGPLKAMDIFPPSLTPLHSYLQFLLDQPSYDIPLVMRENFFLTKVGYLTKPVSLTELAAQCDIKLNIVDSNLHFLEKIVPPFELPKMPGVEEMKELVDVQDYGKDQCEEKCEHINDYLDRKRPCQVKFDISKELYYNSIRSLTKINCDSSTKDDFTFTDILPDGRLAIPDDDSDIKTEEDKGLISNIDIESILLENKLCKQYNLQLSRAEKETIVKPSLLNMLLYKKRRFRYFRNAKGQFVKGSNMVVELTKEQQDPLSDVNDSSLITGTQMSIMEEVSFNLSKTLDENFFLSNGIDINNIDIDNMDIDTSFLNMADPLNLSDLSAFPDNLLSTSANERNQSTGNDEFPFFRPFKDYWMYQCIFSHVRPKNFAVFENSLPQNFRWLLNECALAIETSTEDLYEEVCLVETYLAYVLKNPYSDDRASSTVNRLKNRLNLILSKW
nr:TATA box-binding protein-associated factor RNA polymerase I subunit B [Nomia melanderi]XP_031847499.1 TATA box-binding protein-associated factor RNA polymerase I subunit B [Nomia melanderi]